MANLNIAPINPEQIYKKLGFLVKADQPALIWGAPGCGKSRIVEQWARDNNYGITTRMLSQIQPSDLLIPYVDQANGVLRWAISDWLVELPEDKPHILFFDELPSAPIDVRTAIYQILLDKRLGGFNLPKSTYILAAGNRVTDGASAYEIDTATADRLTHLEVTPDPAQWLDWARRSDLHPYVLTFIKTRPDMLFDNSLDDIVRPSPRSWEKVSDLLKVNSDPNEMAVLIAGRVGTRTAAIFVQTMQELSELPDIPSLYKILGNSNHEIELQRLAPSTLAGYYGLAYGLNAYATSSKKLTQAMYIFKTMTLTKSSLPQKEILTMGLRVFHDTLYQKNWSLKVFSDELYTSQIVEVIMSIPDLNDIANSFN